jgi:hypothetical protein
LEKKEDEELINDVESQELHFPQFVRLCASGRRQNAARDERHIDGCDGTTQSFPNANASSSCSLPIGCFVCFVKQEEVGEKEKTVEKPSRKGMGRRNLALTVLHSLKIKLVHHTRSHTHIYTQALFSSFSCPVQMLFAQPHPHLAPTKTYPTRIRDNHEKSQTIHFLALFFLNDFINIRFGIPSTTTLPINILARLHDSRVLKVIKKITQLIEISVLNI